MRQRKTYAATGLLEYFLNVNHNGVNFKAHFKDGCMGASGFSPARFVTDNRVAQAIIEASAEFRTGKIVIYGRPVDIPDGESRTSAASQNMKDKPRDDENNATDQRCGSPSGSDAPYDV